MDLNVLQNLCKIELSLIASYRLVRHNHKRQPCTESTVNIYILGYLATIFERRSMQFKKTKNARYQLFFYSVKGKLS